MKKQDTEVLDHRLDAERAVLGSLLIDESITRAVMAVVDPQDFQGAENRLIFQAARELFRAGTPVDAMTVRDRIGEQYTPYLLGLMEITPTSANWEEYARLMHEQATTARIRALADQLAEAVTLADCRPVVADLGQLLADGRQVDSWTVPEMMADFFKAQDPETPKPKYITCGIRELDEGSFIEPGDVMMIGGYPSDGKTALALMLAWNMAARYKVGFFSLETSKRKIRDRLISYVAQIDSADIKQRTLSEADWAALAEKSGDMAARDLTVLQGSGMTVTEIQATSQAYGFQVIFVDYVQLVVPELDKRAPRSEQMADVSRSLHTFAQKSGTLVVELAQLSRQERSGGWREPVMQDLKESGQFEQDADLIYLLFRPNPKETDLDQEKNRILKVAKNKEFRRGVWPLYFDGAHQTFSVQLPVQGGDVMRKLVDAGKYAKARNSAEARRNQQVLPEFQDVTDQEAGKLPF